ncbi:protein eva-1 homolog C isoform X1 [Hippocampus comes]|uniref:protein eva-1 homolog C isoform X1 n=1 Tax=Hippocampus comes TaxID=109280 RepID=UPI00094E89A7|nr:PREDICTED: protein eva-1 homolog C-like isoform X1 [Hippocampus comes]XP_019730461.1 PREDICTED: protein eva-1 homolog C-like isoform X1 [Hippocampus comes]
MRDAIPTKESTMTEFRRFGWFLSFLALGINTAHSAPDFSLYLHSVLKNHTAHACEGETLTIECPARTSVAVLSAFFGRRVPQHYLCPSQKTNLTEDAECSSPVAIKKVLSECQDERSCQIPVLGPVFGHDPCPLTSKYLLVYYKCRPEYYRTRLVCENQRLRLACKNDTILAIYSATFGHLLHGSPLCPQGGGSLVDMECLSPSALRKVSRRCHGQANCSVLADTQTFGDPCFPGTRKHLRVSYTCVPRYLLEDVGRGTTDPFMISDYTHGGWYTGPTYRPQNVLLTNSLEMVEKMLGVPERVALYFVSGICAGLVFLLCLFGVHSTLVKDVKELVSDLHDELKAPSRQHKDLIEDLYDDDELSLSDFSLFHHLTQSYRTADVLAAPMLTMEMIAQGAEHSRDLPNGDIWPHPDTNPYAIHQITNYN